MTDTERMEMQICAKINEVWAELMKGTKPTPHEVGLTGAFLELCVAAQERTMTAKQILDAMGVAGAMYTAAMKNITKVAAKEMTRTLKAAKEETH